eukprot:gene31918-40291_t
MSSASSNNEAVFFAKPLLIFKSALAQSFFLAYAGSWIESERHVYPGDVLDEAFDHTKHETRRINDETDERFACVDDARETEECGTRLADLRAVEVVAEAVCESLKLAWLRFYEIADRTYVYTDPDARTIMVSEDPDVADGVDAFRRYDVRFGEVTPLSLVPLPQYKRFLNLDEDVTALEMANCWIVTVFADACNTKGREHLRGLYEH